jgi:phospholipid-binding lipoprotein MlaA
MSLNDQIRSARRKAAGRRAAAGGWVVAAGLAALASTAHAGNPVSAVPAPAASTPAALQANDPLESLNRASFKVGMGIDKAVLGPVAHGYMAVAPKPLRGHVSNVVYNLGEPNTAMNDVLQGKPKMAMRTTTRFIVNSTIGVLGLFDVASHMHLPPHGADFGQTFGKWGASPGAYIYVPVMGPLNVRDAAGRALDIFTDPVSLFVGGFSTDFGKTRTGVTILDLRAVTDPAFDALKDAADPYVTTRSAYTQYRQALVREATGKAEELPDFDAPPPETPRPPAATTP